MSRDSETHSPHRENGPRIWRIKRIRADPITKFANKIRENPPDPRYPRSIDGMQSRECAKEFAQDAHKS